MLQRMTLDGEITGWLPIGVAPIEPGQRFGPCLLYPGLDGCQVIGGFDGDDWYCANGFIVEPTHWQPVSSPDQAAAR